MEEFVHPTLAEQITAIGGSYAFTREVRLEFQGQAVLYLVGWAVVDTSCCGPGGCGIALVPGIVGQWKGAETADGRPISRVIPIRGADAAGIRRLILEKEGPLQVKFL